MQQPQLLIHGVEGRAAELLDELARAQRLWVRSTAHLRACRNLLATARPGLLVLRLGRDLERELELLDETAYLHPETAVVVLVDGDNAALVELAWDLGAHCVLSMPLPVELITSVVAKILAERELGGATE